jgi:hypothetical protein
MHACHRWALSLAAIALATAGLAAQSSYTAPRTPWGDPDLQGNFTNITEAGTSFERPKDFEGKSLKDIPKEELQRLKRQAADRTINAFNGPLEAPDNWWQPAYRLMENGAQAWFVIDPPDGHIPPLTAEAQQRDAARIAARRASGRGPSDSWTDRSLYDRCITRGLPGSMLPSIYGNSFQIVQAPGAVAIVYEMIHETRVIPLDPSTSLGAGRPHVGKGVALDMGDARGHWDGDTLVVDTTNFMERSTYRNANPERLRLIERFTRTASKTVQWTVTVDDPTTWTKPWTFTLPLTMDDTQPLMPYECHEGNYGLKNILSAARADERAAA